MRNKEMVRPILGIVVFVLLAHLSTVHGCSKKSGNADSDNTDDLAKDCQEHVCNDNQKCYSHAQECDGNKDCDDNTDEDVGHCDKKGMPTFENATCTEVTKDSKWDLCIKVNYANDETVDYMLLEDGHGWLTYKGEMKDEKIPVVFSWPDEDDGEVNATTHFDSLHVATCVDFNIDLSGKDSTGISDCVHDHPKGEDVFTNNTFLGKYEAAAKGSLHSGGYELNLDVYFDDDMAEVYGRNSQKTKDKLKSVMTYVKGHFEEKKSLDTIIKIKDNIVHKRGSRWGKIMGDFSRSGQRDNTVWETMGRIAKESSDRHLYAFVTSNTGGAGYGGWAKTRSLCGSRQTRVSITRYQKARGTRYTSEILSHEIGHNLGMEHDHLDHLGPDYPRKDKRGESCYGYMDYIDNTKGWSKCSVEFFTKQKKSCLKKLGGGSTVGPTGCQDERKDCTTIDWACRDTRYKSYMSRVCKKTCRRC